MTEIKKAEALTVSTNDKNPLTREATSSVTGAVAEALKKEDQDAQLAAKYIRVNERMAEEEKKETEAKARYLKSQVEKKRDTTPLTTLMPSHTGEAPKEIVVTNKVVATPKEVEESKKNVATEWASSPFNPKNNPKVVTVR